jgi:hypothetical protein
MSSKLAPHIIAYMRKKELEKYRSNAELHVSINSNSPYVPISDEYLEELEAGARQRARREDESFSPGRYLMSRSYGAC